MNPNAAAFLLLLVPGLVFAVVNLARPALGVRIWTARGHVPLHHALSDPDVVRRRLQTRTVWLALPGLLGGPILLLMGVIAFPAVLDGVEAAGVIAAFILAGGFATAASYRLVWVAWRVRARLPLSERAVTAHGVAATSSIGASALWLSVEVVRAGTADWAWMWIAGAIWLVSAALLANEVRIVATWDRLCASRRPHVEEPSNAKSH